MDGIEDKIEWADAQGKKKVEDLTKIEERIQSLRRDAQVLSFYFLYFFFKSILNLSI